MAGGAETPNIAALPAIPQLGACESARGPDADRHVKLLIQFAVEGSLSGAYSHLAQLRGPLYLDEPTFSVSVGMSEMCQTRKFQHFHMESV
jgi:hypothetical protein